MSRKSLIPIPDLAHAARGFLMGGADIIPGVSGGTVALILGIYNRLVTAISHVDLTFLDHLRQRQFAAAARHIDLRFLVALGCGILLGVAGLANAMHYLLGDHTRRMLTIAVFFGLILASTILVGRMIKQWSPVTVLGLVAGAVVAYWLVGQQFLQSPPAGNGYVFLCGMIAICAMILPGISGAFILLVLGKYEDMIGILRKLLHGDIHATEAVTIAVFLSGCILGLLGFSKLLRWLLARFEVAMMAVLCGFMAGSLRKIWPFKVDRSPDITDFKLKHFENVWPEQFDSQTLLAIGIVVVAAGFVFLLDWMSRLTAPQRVE